MKSRNLFPMILIWALLSSCSSTEKSPDYLGNIKHIKATCATAIDMFGEITPQKIRFVYIADFNEDNVPEVQKYYDEDGNLATVAKNTYDSRKNLIAQTKYNSDGEISSQYKAEYISDNPVLQEMIYTNYYGETEHYKWEFEYKEDILSSIICTMNGKLLSKQIYKETGGRQQTMIYGDDGQLETTTYCQENKNHQMVSFYSSNDSEDNTLKVEYNDRHLPIKIENYKMADVNLTETPVLTIPGDESFKCEYEYDKKGNWIKRIIYEIESDYTTPIYVISREITYR